MEVLCPVCKNILYKEAKTYKCINGHSYDIAKQGYLNINMKSSESTGDNPTMINARRDFLNKGYYDFLRQTVDSLIEENDSLIDLACGEGYYTSYFKAKDKIGVDLSKQGLKIASKNDPKTLYLLNSIFHNHLKDECADKVITIFAPIAKEEIVRLLKKDGKFILVRPDEKHLYELKEVLYDQPYLNEVEDIIVDNLVLDKQIKINKEFIINKEDINNLFMMTPYYNTTSPKDKEKLNDLNELKITFAFVVDVFKK